MKSGAGGGGVRGKEKKANDRKKRQSRFKQ